MKIDDETAAAANAEWHQALENYVDEELKLSKKLSDEGKIYGLDGDREYFKPIQNKLNQRFHEIGIKYGYEKAP
jgi:hypothetical protein